MIVWGPFMRGSSRPAWRNFTSLSSTTRSLRADTAKARTYWVAYTSIGPDHCGYYLDDFRKVGDEWLIAHRRVRLDWESPDSLYMTAVTNTNAG